MRGEEFRHDGRNEALAGAGRRAHAQLAADRCGPIAYLGIGAVELG